MLKFKKTIGGVGRKLVMVKLYNSETYRVGDVVESYTNGVAALATAAKPILGVIQAIVDEHGAPVIEESVTAGTAAGANVTSVTTDATNSDNYYALVDIGKDTVYSAEVNGTIGTTNSSGKIGAKVDVDSANSDLGRVLETTATRAVATTANFFILGTDPDDDERLLVKVANSELEADANTEA